MSSKSSSHFDEKLYSADARSAIEWVRQINVNHSANSGPGAAYPQTDANISQPTIVYSLNRVSTPGSASVKEHGTAYIEQPEWIPVSEQALFDRAQDADIAGLVSQWITAKVVVAADVGCILKIEVFAGRGGQADV